MKKIFSLLLAVAMLAACALSLASCGGPEMKFGKEYRDYDNQMSVLLNLNAKTIDVGVMDSIMAGYYMSQDSTYSNSLQIVDNLVLVEEQYGIAARKGSGLAKKINESLVKLAKAGTVAALAAKYGLTSELCIDTNYEAAPLTDAEKADWEYIQNEGKFVLGYTIFAPICWEEDGALTGFDIDLAKAVAADLGLEVGFHEITDWNTKEALLNAKTIDVIWNGLTITDQRKAEMEITIPYLYNKQVAVIRKEDAAKYTTTASMAEAIIGAERGSAGESCVIVNDEK